VLETGCKYYKDEAMFHGFIPHIMGTRFDILLIHSNAERLNGLWTHIINELERLDKILNRFDPHSEVSKINSHTYQSKIQISKEMESILQLCSYYYETTSHLFDITLKDFSKIQLHEHSCISFISPDISLDFGGFAKGYALKKIKKLIEQENINHAFVNFGNSSILGMGHHPYGDSWRVSFLNPYNQSLLNEFDLKNTTLSTSGNTLQYTGHIMNPLTGLFNEQRKASSIISTDPLEAEILSTVWMIANKEQQLLLTENFKNIQATIYDL
jgi:thiamine biosynthesis lipoprotein